MRLEEKTAKGNILIVDDDKGVARLQALRLERFGHNVYTVNSAEDALSLLEQVSFDLVVLDYSLSTDINGVGLFLIMKERGFSIPAILVTGFEDLNLILQAMRAGIRDFLPKTADYLDDLTLSVERVLKQVALEYQAAESAQIKEKQQLLEAAFDAAKLASAVWDLPINKMKWSGHVVEIFGDNIENKCNTLEDFLSLVHEEDRNSLKENILNNAENKLPPFYFQFRLPDPEGVIKWISIKGRYSFDKNKKPIQMIAVMTNITSQKNAELNLIHSNEQIKALNDRLQLSIVETHHRVKNNLQNIISLLHLQKGNNLGMTEDEVKKLSFQIQGLATLHDVLVDTAKDEEGDTTKVRLKELLERIANAIRQSSDSRPITTNLEDCHVTPRQASSISVIANELLSNALKHGKGLITLKLCNNGEHAEFEVINEGSIFPENFNIHNSDRTGLLLVQALSQADLQASPIFYNPTNHSAAVKLIFPLNEAMNSIR